MKVYIVIELLWHEEERIVACLETKEEVKAFIEEHKDDDILTSLIYEEWEVGKTIYD